MPCFLCKPRKPEDTGVAATPRPNETPHGSSTNRSNNRSQRAVLSASGGVRGSKANSAAVDPPDDVENGALVQQLGSQAAATGGAPLPQQGRKKHPVQENVKAKMEWFESAFGAPPGDAAVSKPKTHGIKHTEVLDVTETEEMTESEVGLVRSGSDSETTVKDCDNDPYEYAYKVWYQKGLLKWRPNSIVPDPDEAGKDLMMDSSTIREISLSPSDDDAALLLQKFHQHGKIKNCATCGKDTSLQIAMVPCNYCTEPLYCSVYCRGNDRYKHAATCAGSRRSTVPWKAADAENKESHQEHSLEESASPEKRGKMIQPPPAAEAVVQATAPTPTTPSLVGLNTEAESTPSKQRSMATTQRAPMVSLFAASPAAAPSPAAASSKTTTTPSPSKIRRTSQASSSSPPLSGAKQYQEVRSQLESIDAPSSSPVLPRDAQPQEQVAKS